ncbi:MAG: hypothetical protein NT003_01265, partial [Candidatus Magasanikbacteria bacterium]|nr:hypothetical protein [Candidatus Magasanikbacteria bacterium]
MIDRVRGFFKKIPNHLMLGIGIFILVVGGYIFSMQGQVNSPDENANLVFARTWKSSQTLFVSNKVAPPTAYPLFPRSVSIVTNGVRPGGFIGLSVLYGSLSIFFGDTSLFYWTLFFTIIAALGWWFLIRRMFGREIADISFWLFLFHPAVLYYSARGLFPNELLLDFTIIAIAAAWYAWEHPRKNIVMILLAIISTLSAIAVRPPEALVIFGIVCVSIMIWSSDRRIRARALTGLGGCAFIAALFFIARLKNWLPGGYQFVELNSVSSLFFPFGIHFKLVAHAVYDFTVRLFTVWSVLPAVGVMWWALESIKEKKDRLISAYVTVIASVSVWL